MSDRRRDILILTGLLVLAVGLRRYGLDWGLPEVFEEATPLKKAWDMWGWDRGGGVDLNPHFFNYPTFSIYLHFLLQGLLYLGLKVGGVITSTLDFQVMYLVDRTPIFLFGRMLSLFLGAGTVLVVYRIGMAGAGKIGAGLAAVLLAVNTYHVDQSQMITVDIPLTFFAMLSLLADVRILERPTRGNYLGAGLALGLATATKYTGALLVLPLLTAHLLARRNPERATEPGPGWLSPVLAVATSVVVFALASPYVILDFESFWASFSVERLHMQIGHFGQDDTPAWQFYFLRLGNTLLGWPVLLAAVAGIALAAAKKSFGWTAVLVVYLVAFLLPMSTWAMKADWYLLPAMPVFLLLAGAGVDRFLNQVPISGRPAVLRRGLAVVILVALAASPLRGYPELWNRSRKDTRTRAMEWIESHLPAGSFILSEYYGPDLLNLSDLLPLSPQAQERLLSGQGSRNVYVVQILPMFQTIPRRSAGFYHLDLYPDADYLIISSAVRSRYEQDLAAFRQHAAFYREVAARWELLREFAPDGSTGPHLVLYRNPLHKQPFGNRQEVTGPKAPAPSAEGLYRDEGYFFFSLGANYLSFGHPGHALASFRMGLQYGPLRPQIHFNLILGTTRALVELGEPAQALDFLAAKANENLPPATDKLISNLRQNILALPLQE